MEREQIEKFRRHMGAGKTIKLKTVDGQEDEFYFKPLTCEFLPDFMQLAHSLEPTTAQKMELNELKNKVRKGELTPDELKIKQEEIDELNSTKIMEGDNARLIVKLIDTMVKVSYPDLDDEIRKTFILNNFTMLQGVLMELNENLGKGEVDEKILKRIEQIKANKSV